MHTFGFKSIINDITRPSSKTCLDHFYVEGWNTLNDDLDGYISHCMITYYYPIMPTANNPYDTQSRKYLGQEMQKKRTENGDKIVNPQRIVDIFNEYYSNLGQNYTEKISIPENFKDVNDSQNDSIFLKPTATEEAEKIVDTLKMKKAPRHDNMTAKCLRELKREISNPITYINGLNRGVCEKVFVSSAVQNHLIDVGEIGPYNNVVPELETKNKLIAALGLICRLEFEELEKKRCSYSQKLRSRRSNVINSKENKTSQCPKFDKVAISSFNKKRHHKMPIKTVTNVVGKQEAAQNTINKNSIKENETIGNVTTEVSELSNAELGFSKPVKDNEFDDARKEDKRHNCPKCPKVYIWRSSMIRHFKTHTEENRKQGLNSTSSFLSKQAFVCKNCAKTFATKNALNSHIGWHKR
ncbi:hypothetical protein WA026_023513 [Henosepilachna vigintioctopunctata]|uniref:C2H2-type domain-containing protein n=1 Tax=Henosepilachna vigintioctopunctata TaxID=420089 RepID=A0AAW1TS81_9CUCU